MKHSPENIRKGLKLFGLLSLFIAAVLVTFGVGVAAAGSTTIAFAVVAGAPVSTTTVQEGSPNLLDPSISDKITEMFPSKNPLNHVLRQIGVVPMRGDNGTGAYIHKFYSIDARPIQATVAAAYTKSTDRSAAITLASGQAEMFTENDTISVIPPAGTAPGYEYNGSVETPKGTLQLTVLSVDRGGNKITVQATNAQRTTATNEATAYLPSIPVNTKFIRMGTALRESDLQTDAWADIPEDDYNYIQTFGGRFEATPEELQHLKEVKWDLSKIAARTMREITESEERSILLGMRTQFNSVSSNSPGKRYTMGGLLYFVDNVFAYNTSAGFKKTDYNSMMRQLFANNSGENLRYMFMGSGFAEQLSNIDEVQKQTSSNTPTVKYGINFTGFHNVFGSINSMLHPMLDLTGHANDALVIDISNINLVRWGSMYVKELDLSPIGKDLVAQALKEKLSLEVRYPSTHMLIKGI
jgi:hypothetical protein